MSNKIYTLNKYFNINKNEYIFNNSIIEYKNHYIMVYRHIIYNNNNKIHPWKAWCQSYEETDKKIIEKNKSLLVNIKLFSLEKYRDILDYDYFIDMNYTSNNIIDINSHTDTTGLCIFEKNKDFDKIVMIYNNPIFFKNFNQDSRIYNINNEIFISYNGFIRKNDDLHVKLLYRKIIINLDNNYIYIGQELPLINQSLNIERKVEKNCIFDSKKNVIYDINGVFKYIDKKKGLISNNIKGLIDIINFYGKSNIFFSLSTPIQHIFINNKKHYIALGHCKVNYKNINKNTQFFHFLKQIDFTNIKMHGKFIYFMFFYVFDDSYNITHFSHSFIPTDNYNSHLPYLLVFPTGLYISDNNYIISYGEGDEYSKVIILSQKNILDLLYPIDKLNIDYNFLFYNINEKKYIENNNDIYTYLVYGYYSMFNAGDDAFKLVFNNYFKNINKNKKYIVNYLNPSSINSYFNSIYDEIIIGGGDIINPYFLNNIINFNNNNNIKITAISVGIPYLDNIHYLNNFNKIYLRNNKDYNDIINNKYKYVLNINNIYYTSDICFGLNTDNHLIDLNIDNNKINIGVFLCRPFYNKDYEDFYNNLIFKISLLLNKILNINKNINIYLIPFNINSNNIKENDCIINNHIKSLNYLNNRIINVNFELFDKTIYVEQINTLIKKLNFGICSRFHSHVFCCNNNIPFISLSCTRKVKELLLEIDLIDIYSKLECINDVPFDFNLEKTINIFKNILNNELYYKNKIKLILSNMIKNNILL